MAKILQLFLSEGVTPYLGLVYSSNNRDGEPGFTFPEGCPKGRPYLPDQHHEQRKCQLQVPMMLLLMCW